MDPKFHILHIKLEMFKYHMVYQQFIRIMNCAYVFITHQSNIVKMFAFICL